MKHRIFRPRIFSLFLLFGAVASAQDVASFEKRITVKTPNGLTILDRVRTTRGPCFLVLHAGRRRFCAGSYGADRSGSHVRAYGFQRHRDDRDHRLRRREGGAGKSGEGLRRLHSRSATKTSAETKMKLKATGKSLEGRHRRGRQICRSQSVWQDHRTKRRSGSQRLH